jgi:Flp pilus assembly protein TadG
LPIQTGMRRLSYIRRRLRRDEGQALVELALAMPLLLLLLTAIFQFGMVFNDYEALTDAARTGARSLAIEYGSTDPCDAAVTQTITSAAGVVTLLGTQVFPTFASSTGGTTTKSYCGSSAGVGCTNYAYKSTCNSSGAELAGDEATITVRYSVPISVFGFKITNIALSTQSSDAVE